MQSTSTGHPTVDAVLGQIAAAGFAMVPNVCTAGEVDQLLAELTSALAEPGAAVLERDGVIYAARNVLQTWPGSALAWRREPVISLLRQILGPSFGLVRALYFDKPPMQSWSLP